MDRRLRDPPVNGTSLMADRDGEEAGPAARGRLWVTVAVEGGQEVPPSPSGLLALA